MSTDTLDEASACFELLHDHRDKSTAELAIALDLYDGSDVVGQPNCVLYAQTASGECGDIAAIRVSREYIRVFSSNRSLMMRILDIAKPACPISKAVAEEWQALQISA